MSHAEGRGRLKAAGSINEGNVATLHCMLNQERLCCLIHKERKELAPHA